MNQLEHHQNLLQPITPPSRAAHKLAYAITEFNLKLDGLSCADFGANSGGFTAVMLNAGALKVYAVETGYGVLDWKLRNNSSVLVMERTNALHVNLPEKVDLITIDTSWTRQKNILASAILNLKPGGQIITLVKPHYEAEPKDIRKGKLNPERIPDILEQVERDILKLSIEILEKRDSPITGKSGKNQEYLWLLKPDLQES